ncbi:MAG: FAD-binding oxidoreductase [bacterium]|nr:FAD-binding oxidoreductase [bacterium]
MLSFWEKNSLIKYDYIVIGAGITGLSVACELKEKHPHKQILVLEKGLLPTGASTKNAGFACVGSLSENLHDINLMGEENLLQLVENRWMGLQLLRARLGDHAIGFESHGGYELILKNQDDAFVSQLPQMNALLYPLFKKNVFSFRPNDIAKFGFAQNQVQSLVFNEVEGQLDTGKMMQELWLYTQKLGVKIITGAEVLSIQENSNHVMIDLLDMAFYAQQIFICTNAFTQKLVSGIELNPGRGQVIATAPIPNLKVKGIFFFDDGYYYFKNFENRIIFGGGRNLDFKGEETAAFGSNQKILDQLEVYLKTIILPNTAFEIEYKWSGIMAFGKDKLPLVKRLSERQFMGVRLNGMGVALGSKIAKDLVDLM